MFTPRCEIPPEQLLEQVQKHVSTILCHEMGGPKSPTVEHNEVRIFTHAPIGFLPNSEPRREKVPDAGGNLFV